jgi:hypothetical protein
MITKKTTRILIGQKIQKILGFVFRENMVGVSSSIIPEPNFLLKNKLDI